MKYLILSIMLFLNYNLISQNLNFDFQEYNPPKKWAEPELYIPAAVMVYTFTINESLRGQISYNDRSMIAATGIITAISSHFILRKIREKKERKIIFK